MNLLLLLSYPACTVVDVSVGRRHAQEPCDTADTATESDTASDTDTETDVEPAAPAWSPGALETLVEVVGTRSTTGVWLFDATGDGVDDLVTSAMEFDGSAYARLTLSVFPNRGDGRFDPPSVMTSAASGFYAAPLLVDLDDDGQMDMVAANGTGISLFGGDRGGFSAEVNWDTGRGFYGQSLGAADFDGDGAAEVVVLGYGNRSGQPAMKLLGRDRAGALGLTLEGYPVSSFAYSMVPVDFDGDGREGALFGDFTSGYDYQVEVYEAWGTETLAYTGAWQTRFSNDATMFGFAADGNGDGLDELVSQGVDGLQVFDPEVGHAELLRVNDFENYPTGAVGYDLDGNGEMDALESLYHYESSDLGYSYGQRLAWSLRDDGEFLDSEAMDFEIMPLGWGSQSLAAGDVNVDGCGDVVFIEGYGSVQLSLGDCGG